MVNHPPEGVLANVIPITVNIRRSMIPQSLLRYIPTIKEAAFHNDEVIFVGLFSITFIPSGSELFMNYADAFGLESFSGRVGQIEWLGERATIDEEFLIKKEFTFDVPQSLKRLSAVKKHLPLNMQLEYTKEHVQLLKNADKLMQLIADTPKAQLEGKDKMVEGTKDEPKQSITAPKDSNTTEQQPDPSSKSKK